MKIAKMLRNFLHRGFAKYTHDSSEIGRRTIRKIYPAPGENLEVPDWTVSTFFSKIGMGSSEFSGNFEN